MTYEAGTVYLDVDDLLALHARFATGTIRADTLRAWIADHVVPDSAS